MGITGAMTARLKAVRQWTREHTKSALTAAIGILILTPDPATAQRVIALQPAPKCATCRIVLERVATLSDADFAINGSRTIVTRDNRDRFLVVGEKSSSIGVYSATGKLLKQVGRRGDGLGEFRNIATILVGPGDSIHVIDAALGRRTVFDPTLSRAVRTTPVPQFAEAAITGDGRLLVTGSIATRESAGLPVHLVASNGTILRSFGDDDMLVTARGNERRRLYRSITPARGGGYWVSPMTQYTIERWTDKLTHESTFKRAVDWFPPLPLDAVLGSPEVQRPHTLLRSVWEEPSGVVLVNIGVAAVNWRPTAVESGGESTVTPVSELGKYIDTILEAVDPRAATVLATLRVRGILGQVGNGPYLWSVRHGANGSVAVDVLRMEYVQ